MQQRRLVSWFTALVVFALLFSATCSSSGGSDVERQPPAPAPEAAPPDFQALLPGPQQLLTGRPQPRTASFSEEDFINYGADFEAALPHRNALSAPGQSVEFQPSWSEANGMDPSQLALCVYKFAITNYDRAPELRYGWGIEPADARSVWFGLSDWQADTWAWRRGEQDRIISFSSLDPYFSETDELYVVVVCASDEISVLRYLRLGEMPPASVQLAVTPRYSRPPVTIYGDASGSAMPVGTIESYEWDWDHDGTFEEDTDDNPHSNAVFDEVGNHEFAVRVTSSYGEQAEATATFSIVEPWTHSWGTDLYQDLGAVATDGSEYCYVAGSTMTDGGHRDALLLKYRLDGELQWAATWGGADYDALSDIRYSQGDIFTVGATKSYGAGDYDVLLQRWNTSGEVLWTRVWGTAGEDRGAALALTNNAVYVVGGTEALSNPDVILVKYDLDGQFVVAYTWGDLAYDVGTDIATSYQPLSDEYSIYVTGATSSPNPSYQDVLYLQLDEIGNFNAQRAWHSLSVDDSRGNAITVSGLLTKDVYIAGSMGPGGQREGFVLDVGSGTDYFARGLGNPVNVENVAEDVVRLGDRLYLTGRVWELGVSSGAFLEDLPLTGIVGFNRVVWDDDNPNTGGTALAPFPGSGLLIGGNCQAATLGAWGGAPGNPIERNGTWSDFGATVVVPVGSEESPATAAQLVTGGVIDTGGGDWDTLLSVVVTM